MIPWTLAARNLLVRPGRAVVLLLGYALGVAVMIVLLSVGDAMLDQSRDASLVGGGELTVLPAGVDREALRSGGLTGMFFGIDGARFVARQLIGGPRHRDLVRSVSPLIEQKLLMLRSGSRSIAVRAGADIPDAATAAASGIQVVSGGWHNDPLDQDWIGPSPQQLYDQLDHFHRPAVPDSSWAEWHYANIIVSDREWWYFTVMVAGNPAGSRGGGEVLVTHRKPDGSYQRFAAPTPGSAVIFDTTIADVTVGSSSVTQRDGVYHFRGIAGAASFDFALTPSPNRYFPPVDLGADHERSGYAVAALTGSASGRLCVGPRCEEVHGAAAYHDHNWGGWRGVTWEWGAGRGARHALIYGGVIPEGGAGGQVPFFLAVEDSLGVEQVYRFTDVERVGTRLVAGMAGVSAPDSLRIVATRGADTLTIRIAVLDAAGSTSLAAGPGRAFTQMRGHWSLAGRAAGAAVADTGSGFFETWASRSTPRAQ